MIRETCGTMRGALAHQKAKEPWCGWCLQAEADVRHQAAVARLEAELTSGWPSPEHARGPVADILAAIHRAELEDALLDVRDDETRGAGRDAPPFGREDDGTVDEIAVRLVANGESSAARPVALSHPERVLAARRVLADPEGTQRMVMDRLHVSKGYARQLAREAKKARVAAA